MATKKHKAKLRIAKMTETAVETTSKLVVRGRQKKVDAPYTITFLDGDGKESARIPAVVTAVRVTGADKKARTVALRDFPAAVLGQFAADGMRKKLGFFLKDVTKENQSNIDELVGELVTSGKNATIYVPKEGGGPGRTYDYDFWLDVLARTAEIKVKAGNEKAKIMTPEARAEARVKLEAMTSDERKEKQRKWEKDKVFVNAAAQVRAERAKAKLNVAAAANADEYDASADI
jgi:hypothetical protein